MRLVLLCLVLKPILTGGTPVPRGMGILPMRCLSLEPDVCATRSSLNRVILAALPQMLVPARLGRSLALPQPLPPRQKPFHPLSRRLRFRVAPGLAIRPAQQFIGFLVVHDTLFLRIPGQR